MMTSFLVKEYNLAEPAISYEMGIRPTYGEAKLVVDELNASLSKRYELVSQEISPLTPKVLSNGITAFYHENNQKIFEIVPFDDNKIYDENHKQLRRSL